MADKSLEDIPIVRADPLDDITEKAHAEANGVRVAPGRYVFTVPEGVEPGDLVVIDIKVAE